MGKDVGVTEDASTEREPGLRERKRLATRHAILLATVELAEERGLDGVTVEEISRRAEVSPRTFFNYFPGKERALAGDGPELPDAERVERFVQGEGPLLEDLADLLVASSQHLLHDQAAVSRRLALSAKHPQLVGLRMAGMRQFEDELVEVVGRRLAREDAALAEHADELASRARLLVYTASGVMRHAWHHWVVGAGASGPEADLRASMRMLAELIGTARAR